MYQHYREIYFWYLTNVLCGEVLWWKKIGKEKNKNVTCIFQCAIHIHSRVFVL